MECLKANVLVDNKFSMHFYADILVLFIQYMNIN